MESVIRITSTGNIVVNTEARKGHGDLKTKKQKAPPPLQKVNRYNNELCNTFPRIRKPFTQVLSSYSLPRFTLLVWVLSDCKIRFIDELYSFST